MAASNSHNPTEPVHNDLGPLAWVLGEVRASLDASSKALKRFVRDAAHSRGKDLASIDSSQLRLAKQQLRQVVGALEMVDLEKPAQFLRAMESAVERFVDNPELCSDEAADKIETAGFALTAYLEGILAGRKTSAVALFPQYEEVQKLAAAQRLHPADLWENRWRWAAIAAPEHTTALHLDASVRAQIDAPVLQVMRSLNSQAAHSLEQTAAGLSLSAQMSAQQQTLWRLAAGFFAAVAHKLLPADLYVKRAATGVLLQATEQIKDASSLNTRLAQDLLFFNAHLQNTAEIPTAVAAVLAAYQLQDTKANDYHKRVFGHYDPALLVQARKRIAAVKETWSLVTAGESNKYQLIKDQIQAIAESITKLFPAGQDLANALLSVADSIVQQGKPPATHVAMEVATSLLYAEAVLEDADLANPDLEARTQRLAERIANAQQGGVAHPLDAWMEELYRQVSDRQNMGSVVGELKISLGELEKLMDQFFRNTEDLAPLAQVPDKLAQMRGVMSILGLDDAIKSVQWMREHIEHIAIGHLSIADAQDTGIFDKVGTNLGALGFLIDMLSYQPVLAKKLFVYDKDSNELKPLMGRAPARTEQVTEPSHEVNSSSPAAPSAAAAEQVSAPVAQAALPSWELDNATPLEQSVTTEPLTHASATLFEATTKLNLTDFESTQILNPTATPSAQPDTEAAPTLDADFSLNFDIPTEHVETASAIEQTETVTHTATSLLQEAAPVAAPPTAAIEGLDDELLEIFLEEAAEVVTQGQAAIEQLRTTPHESAELTTLRRSFHTLKGSSRMVGLTAFGESAWQMEQVLNTWLADAKPASEAMLDLSAQAMNIFGDWAARLRDQRNDGAYQAAPFQASSEAIRSQQIYLPLAFDTDNLIADQETDKPIDAAAATSSSSWEQAPTKLPSLDEVLQQQAQAQADHLVTQPLTADLITEAPTDTTEQASLTSTADHLNLALDVQELAPSTDGDFDFFASATDKTAALEPEAQLLPTSAIEENPEVSLNDADLALFEFDTATTNAQPSAQLEPQSEPDVTFSSTDDALSFDAFNINSGTTEQEQSFTPAASNDFTPASQPLEQPEDEGYKVIGDLRISIPLYNAFLGEADDWSRRLVSEITEWALDPQSELSNSPVALAHSLAGTSGTVGHMALSDFARALEHCLARDLHLDEPRSAHRHAETYTASAEEIRRLLHQFAAGILHTPNPQIQSRLQLALNDDESQTQPSERMHIEDLLLAQDEQEVHAEQHDAHDSAPALVATLESPQHRDSIAAIDTDLFPIFQEEADELLPELGANLRQWHEQPADEAARGAVLRVLHTLKGSARLAGAMHLGEMVHNIESDIEMLGAEGVPAAEIAQLIDRSDDINNAFEDLCQRLQTGQEAAPTTAPTQAAFAPPADAAIEAIDIVTLSDTTEVPEPETVSPSIEVIEAMELTAPIEVLEDANDAVTLPPIDAPPISVQTLTPVPTSRTVGSAASVHADTRIDAQDSIDENLFPIFEDEANELLPELGASLRQWQAAPADTQARSSVLRILHTLKGSARLAGAMRLGEMAHRLESNIELLGTEQVATTEIEHLLSANDEINETFHALSQQQQLGDELAWATPAADSPDWAPATADAQAQKLVDQHLAQLSDTAAATAESTAADDLDADASDTAPAADTSYEAAASSAEEPEESEHPALPARLSYVVDNGESSNQTVRVRSHLLDLLVNLAGEVMITRAKLENEIGTQLRTSINDLTGNLERLRQHLRDIEVQSESQMQSRLTLSKEASQSFDPLEFDRFTRVQELTRMMAESVNDVATVQRNMQAVVDATEGALVAQARQTRELQRYLLRTRMVEFDSISDRLYRVIRQAGKDTGKQVRLDIVGASIELDRGVLERMTAAFEHLLRNCVAHGIEAPENRHAAGKEAAGLITIQVQQEGNDVAIEFKDDGAGLNVAKILEKAEQKGLITKQTVMSDQDIFNLIYSPGFSTATEVSTIAGRGVGMDVVKSEVQALGGRIETHSVTGKGSSFKLVLPLTTAVTQVVMVRAGHLTFGVPANLLEIVRRATPEELAAAYQERSIHFQGETVPFHWAGALLQASPASVEPVGRSTPIVVIRSAAQRVAVHVDEVLGNQEVVVKNLGPQLSRLPGLAGMSLLPSGAVVLIYNPVALHTVYRERAAAFIEQAKQNQLQGQSTSEAQTPLVMVVDDSVTVRRVTQRLLQREGYRVVLANDGLMALEKLAEGEELPRVILSDIEMPRMDGYDLARNIRADARLADLPIVMITSRMAEKHREHAMSLGVNHYLGKPYGEEELLEIIHSYTHALASV